MRWYSFFSFFFLLYFRLWFARWDDQYVCIFQRVVLQAKLYNKARCLRANHPLLAPIFSDLCFLRWEPIPRTAVFYTMMPTAGKGLKAVTFLLPAFECGKQWSGLSWCRISLVNMDSIPLGPVLYLFPRVLTDLLCWTRVQELSLSGLR